MNKEGEIIIGLAVFAGFIWLMTLIFPFYTIIIIFITLVLINHFEGNNKLETFLNWPLKWKILITIAYLSFVIWSSVDYCIDRYTPDFKSYYSSGVIEKAYFLDGEVKDGKYREYHENGELKIKGSYDDGKKIGIWKYYDSSGGAQLRFVPNFKIKKVARIAHL